MKIDSPKKILLVEDDPIVAMVGKKTLAKYGYNVLHASSGEMAVDAFASHQDIDLVLMDIDLGYGVDGTEAAALILDQRDIPVVFLSSHTEPDIVEKTEKITSYGYVVKNSSATVLDASIKMAFKLFEAKQARTKINAKLEATLAALPDVLIEIGLDGYIYDYHSSRSELLGKPAAEVIGSNISEAAPAQVSDLIMAAIREAHLHGFSQGTQYELAVPAGKRWFEISVAGTKSAPNAPRFLILRRDITDRKEVEAALRESEEKYRLIFENAPLGLLSFDNNGLITACNENFGQIIGTPCAKLCGLNMLNLQDVKLIQAVRESLQGKLGIYEDYYRSVTADKLTPVRVLFAPLKNAEGEITGGVGIVEDTTQRVKAENMLKLEQIRLKKSEERHREAERIAHLGSWEYDVLADTLIFSDEFFRFLGIDPADFPGTDGAYREFIHPEDREEVEGIFDASVREGYGYEIEYRIIRKDNGQVRYVRDRSEQVKNSAGKVLRTIGTVLDITEAKLAAEALRANEAKHRKMVANIKDVIVIIDQDGINRYKSPNIEALFGWKPAEVIGKSTWDNVHPEDVESAQKIVGAVLAQGGATAMLECRYRCKDGSYKWIELFCVNLLDDPDIQGILGNYHDITERKQVE